MNFPIDPANRSDKLFFMPEYEAPQKTLEQVAEEVGIYALDAYHFVQEGLVYTGDKLHGPRNLRGPHHVSGQQLAEGLREIAIRQWGMLARTVLERWGIVSTLDFGRIVYAMIAAGMMSKTDEDSLDDFRNVYDFRNAFEKTFRIELQPVLA